MTMLSVPMKVLSENAVVPKNAYDGDAGVDLCSTEEVVLQPFQRQADGYAARACAYVQCTLSGLCLLQDEACQFGCLGSRNEHPRLHMEGASEEFTRSQHILHGFAFLKSLHHFFQSVGVVSR